MPLIDLIIQDLHKEIDCRVPEGVGPDTFGSEEDAYNAGVADASDGAEAYLRKIFPDK